MLVVDYKKTNCPCVYSSYVLLKFNTPWVSLYAEFYFQLLFDIWNFVKNHLVVVLSEVFFSNLLPGKGPSDIGLIPVEVELMRACDKI